MGCQAISVVVVRAFPVGVIVGDRASLALFRSLAGQCADIGVEQAPVDFVGNRDLIGRARGRDILRGLLRLIVRRLALVRARGCHAERNSACRDQQRAARTNEQEAGYMQSSGLRHHGSSSDGAYHQAGGTTRVNIIFR